MKNNKKIKKIISILLMILLLVVTTKVYAANDSFGTTLKASSIQAKSGENITITIGLKDIAIESAENGIGSYTANIKFDPSVLEYVSSSGIGKWEKPFYQGGLITAHTDDAEVVKTAQDIGSMTFRVKADAKPGETTIELTNFSGSTAVIDVPAKSNESIKVTIIGNNSDNNSDSSNASKPGNISNENTGKLPYTGVTDTIVFVAIGVCSIFAIIFFIRMKVLIIK